MTSLNTPQGPVRGVTEGGIAKFRGIPFAAAPVGALRFRPPQPAAAWTETRDASRFGPAPMQARPASGRCDEDCLTVNVWTPQPDRSAKLPVLVWFFGGGFTAGEGFEPLADGSNFARDGVVVVSFNYRVGIFGFLAHPELAAESDASVSGNYGLLDQIAALQWVRENIEAYGGDPSRVVTAGVSAGSAAIALLMTSPLARGLFHGAILESPGTFRPLATLEQAQAAGAALGPIEALRALPAAELLTAKQPMLVPAMRELTAPRILRPIHDGSVIPLQERNAYLQGAFAHIPVLVGTNVDEGTALTRQWSLNQPQELTALIEKSFPRHREQALAFYGTADATRVTSRVAEMFGDTQFQYGARGLAQAAARHQPQTFRYLFTRRKPGQTDGPHHTDEVVYAFDNLSQLPPAALAPTDGEVSRVMHRAWLNFIRNSDPNGPDVPHWPSVREEPDALMEFGDEPRVTRGFRNAQLDLVDAHFESAPPP